jgi:hypothetical protein
VQKTKPSVPAVMRLYSAAYIASRRRKRVLMALAFTAFIAAYFAASTQRAIALTGAGMAAVLVASRKPKC